MIFILHIHVLIIKLVYYLKPKCIIKGMRNKINVRITLEKSLTFNDTFKTNVQI